MTTAIFRLTIAIMSLIFIASCTGPSPTDKSARSGHNSADACLDGDANQFMAVAANPEAAKIGCELLAKGGTAIDAAIAIQASLTVVEPQSSGFGGGALLTYYDSATSTTTVFDGLATAGSVTTASLSTPTKKERKSHNIDRFSQAVYRTPRAVGVPGVVAALDMAHKQYGRQPWDKLFDQAIEQARSGFALAPGTANALHGGSPLPTCKYPDIAAIYCNDERPKTEGSTITNPQLAGLLEEIRDGGSDAFYDPQGRIAPQIVARLHSGDFDLTDRDGDPAAIPGLLSKDDFKEYRAVERKPLCQTTLTRRLCTAPAPSFGGTALLNLLQMADARGIDSYEMNSANYAQIVTEASRLSGVDGRTYIGDPEFDSRPPLDLASASYADRRAQSIRPNTTIHPVQPGSAGGKAAPTLDPTDPQDQTSQIVVVDSDGDALSMTTTVNANFGARVAARGMVLNNANGNFSAAGSNVNEMEPRKRPRTTMAPTIGFDTHGMARIIVGSAGGAAIHDYIAQAILGIETYGLSPEQALARPHLSGQTRVTDCAGQPDYVSEVETATPAEKLLPHLKKRGAMCAQSATLHSGTGAISVDSDGTMRGAADPRRDGAAFGG